MKSRNQSFSFMMELIIVIFFFAVASSVCVSFIAGAKKKVDEGQKIQSSLLEAQNMINILQLESDKSIEELFEVEQEGQSYKYRDMIIKIYTESNIKKGTIIINEDIEFNFVIGEADE